ncbi:MAG: hypothetical protein ACKVT2_18460 [Saprospiraceae bacterium]
MKHIQKQREPDSLRQLLNTAGAAYTGPQPDWQEALLNEQGHICAYCMGRISMERTSGKGSKPKIEIEHYQSRERSPQLQLIWRNMLGVCNGNHGLKPHCDKSVGGCDQNKVFIKGKGHGEVSLARLNPLRYEDSEALLTYSLSGNILSHAQIPSLEEDLNHRLNLNDERLVEFRKDQIDLAKKLLEKNYPDRRWDQRVFDKEIEAWSTQSDGKYKPYLMAVIWFLNWLKQRPKFN